MYDWLWVIGASMNEPHTSELKCDFILLSVVHRSIYP